MQDFDGFSFHRVDHNVGERRNHKFSGAAAKATGAPTLNYGVFMNAVLNFVIVAVGVFLLVRQVNRFRNLQTVEMKECPHCFSGMLKKATRCPYCTSAVGEANPQVAAT